MGDADSEWLLNAERKTEVSIGMKNEVSAQMRTASGKKGLFPEVVGVVHLRLHPMTRNTWRNIHKYCADRIADLSSPLIA